MYYIIEITILGLAASLSKRVGALLSFTIRLDHVLPCFILQNKDL
jgi:hypothetical protein